MTLLHTLAGKTRDLRGLRRFKRSEDGVVSIEFAFIVPILILLYAGVFQLSMVIMQLRSVSHASSVMGDLTTQSASVDELDVEQFMEAAIAILQINNGDVFTNGDVQLQIISYDIDPSTNSPREIGRAETSGFKNTEPVKPADIDSRLLSSDSGAVVARVSYDYRFLSNGSGTKNPFAGGFFGDSVSLEEHYIFKPRLSDTLPMAGTSNAAHNYFDCSIDGDGDVTCTASA